MEQQNEMHEFKGLRVSKVVRGTDDGGYGFLKIEFEGGVWLEVEEIGQVGEIKVTDSGGHAYYPQDE